MKRDSKIKVKKVLDVTDLSGEKVMVDFESGKYFLVKGTGNDIWDMLEDGITIQKIIEQLLEEFDVTEEFCEKEVFSFLGKLESLGIIGEM